MRQDLIEILKTVRTQLDRGHLATASFALSDYWAKANMGNTTRANDLRAIALSREINSHQQPIPRTV
jgi:hypothetical protein